MRTRLRGGLFGCGVVVDDVAHDVGQLLHLAALKVRFQQLEQLGLQGLVHQNVGALTLKLTPEEMASLDKESRLIR